MTSASPIDNMIEALGLEVEAIKRNTSASLLELRGGIRQEVEGADTLYSFPLGEEPNLRDDLPVQVVIPGRDKQEISGTVVSVRAGILTVALGEDLGPQIPLARLRANDSFLVERLREKLLDVKNGTTKFNTASANAALGNVPSHVGEAEVPDVVFTIDKPLNEIQRRAVRQSASSSLVYLWGPPGTGKTSTLAAVVHALYLQGKRILLVSNTNIAVDTALERIGDRLSRLPEFHEGAILRFGHIASSTLKEKYESQVDIAKVVERHSAVLSERRSELQREADSLQARAIDTGAALKTHEQFRMLLAGLEQIKQQYSQLASQAEQQHNDIASLTALLQRTEADLARVQPMGAIRRLFSGLNEDQLKRTLAQSRIRLQSLNGSAASIASQQERLKAKHSTDQQEASRLRRRVTSMPDERSCRMDLEAYGRRLDAIKTDITTVNEQLESIRVQLISNCRVVATTVYQSYMKRELASREYDVVIVDEASMLPLPMVYYAAGLATERVIVAGDFRQLPPIVVSDSAECAHWLKRDVFHAAGIADAVGRKQSPPALVTLREQYRMQGDICDLVNSFFYDGHLKSSDAVRTQTAKERPFGTSLNGLLYVDTSTWNPWTAYRLGTWSRYNVLHALLIRNLVGRLERSGFLSGSNDRLGVVAPYGAQCQLLARLIGEAFKVPGAKYAATVHRFQGNERDAMIFDLTDSTGCPVGRFFKAQSIEEDGARMLNVAISRARLCTVFVANFRFLRGKFGSNSYLMRRLIGHLDKHGEPLDVADCFPFDPTQILAGHQAATGALATEIDGDGLTAFTEGTFYSAFEADCRNARREIVIFSPFMTTRGTGRWVELWRAKVAQGLKVRLVTRPPGDQGGSLDQGLAELIDNIRELGVVVDQRARMHEKMAFIDGQKLWHGSLNILSHRDTSESMLRVKSSAACQQVGRFVLAKKIDEKSDCDLASQENPSCAACGKPMVWNNGRNGIWFECECGQKAKTAERQWRPMQRPLPLESAVQPQTNPQPSNRNGDGAVAAVSASACIEIYYWAQKNNVGENRRRKLAYNLGVMKRVGATPTPEQAAQGGRLLAELYQAAQQLGFPPPEVPWDQIRRALGRANR